MITGARASERLALRPAAVVQLWVVERVSDAELSWVDRQKEPRARVEADMR